MGSTGNGYLRRRIKWTNRQLVASFTMPVYFCLVIGMAFAGCTSISKEVLDYRESRKTGFLHDPRSPLEESDLALLDYFEPHKAAKVIARVTLTPGEEPFELPTYSGVTRTYRKWAIATFSWEGKEATLALYENMTHRANPVYKDHLFLPFKDETNGVSTYGGGRYIDLSKPDVENGKIIIDFNRCYNPWCAYSDGFNCPIPPRENHLPFEVNAGERKYRGDVKAAK